ncbi:hypothetical protein IPM62_05520 [Candidatus Woesebacteria bacterium]|nr:MAG: hypothetical protein IPM62_05520 [Candidatus Woesebacteria bacterium]
MKFLENVLIKILSVIFSPLIDKDGFLKLPKNKKGRIRILYLLMLSVMVVSVIYFLTQDAIFRLPLLIMEE